MTYVSRPPNCAGAKSIQAAPSSTRTNAASRLLNWRRRDRIAYCAATTRSSSAAVAVTPVTVQSHVVPLVFVQLNQVLLVLTSLAFTVAGAAAPAPGVTVKVTLSMLAGLVAFSV